MHTFKIPCAAVVVCLALVVDGTFFARSQMLSKSLVRESLPGHRNKEIPTTFSPLELLMILFKPDSGTRESGDLVQKSAEGKRALVRRGNSDSEDEIRKFGSEDESKRGLDRIGCRFVFYWKSWASCR